ncbi:LPD38 domain-containing protein [Aeromonas jandaei]|uniref:LPD38 domain-containing protein n=1 Tax=Aeromonas jandaei TaxID=650 RepID=UPI00366A6EA9
MDKFSLRDTLPSPQQSDTRMDGFWADMRQQFNNPTTEPKRDLDTELSDYPKAIGAGALELVGGIGELARGVISHGNENKGKTAWGNVASAISPLATGVSAVGDLAQSGADALTESMSSDAKEAINRRLVDETPEGRLTIGDGAGDIDVWAMKMAQGVGSLVPTLLAGGVTGVAAKASIGRAVTASMIKRGATQEVAEAVAAKTVSKLATGAAATAGATGSVGSAGVNTRDAVLGMSFDELAQSDTFRQAFTRIDQDQQAQHLSDEEKLAKAREETANIASRATMSDAKTWGAAAMGSMMGDAMLFKMLAGKAATGGVLKGAAKGAVGEGIGETLEEGVQQYAVNESLNDVAAADIDPMKGVVSSALEGGLIGMGTGGAVGAGGGLRGGKTNVAGDSNAKVDPATVEDMAPTEQSEQVQANPAAAPVEQDLASAVDAMAEPVVQEADKSPLGPSASQFPGVFERDQRGILRVKGDVDALASWAEQADMPYITDGDGIAIPAKYAKQAEKAIKGYQPVPDAPAVEPVPQADIPSFSEVDPIEETPAFLRQSIAQAGSETDSVFGPLQTMRITKRGKPFSSEKEAEYASRKGKEMPVPLNGGGFGVAEIAEIEQAKAAATTKPSDPQLDDISVTDPNQPSDQPAASVSAETVPAPSATAGEASQLAPAIDTGYREVIPVNQPQAEVSNEPVTTVPASGSEGQGDQHGAGEPAAAGARPAIAGLTDRAGSGNPADNTPAPSVPDGQPENDQALTAPAIDAGAAVSEPVAPEPNAAPTPWAEAIDNPDGTITLKGDVPLIKQWAKESGVKAMPGKGGLLVATSSAAKVREYVAPAASEPVPKIEDDASPVRKVRMSQQRAELSADEVAQIVSDFRREYKGTRSLDFIVGQTQEDLYGPEGSPERIGWRDGGYLPSKQQVHLIADSITRRAGRQDIYEGAGGEGGVSGHSVLGQSDRYSPGNGQGVGRVERAKAEVVSTLRHEVLGHYGLDTFTPENKQSLLKKLSDAKNEKWLKPTWSEISRPEMYGGDSDLHQAEEVFARLTESALPSRSIQAWNDIKTELSRMLRKTGLAKGPIKEHELDSLIRALGKGIRNGERTLQNIRGDKEVTGKQASEPAKPGKPERIISFSKQAMAQGDKPANHLTRKEAEAVTKEWFKQYRGASGIDVQIHATQAELEKALGLAAKDGLIRRAAFDDDTGTLHVAADTIANPKRMREILRHEVLAHYGLANVLGDGEYTKLISRLIKSKKDPSMKAVWEWVDTHYADEDIGVQAEEVIAHLAELEPSAWRRGWDTVAAWVTKALRMVGFAPDGITAAETRNLIEALGKKMKRGGPDDGGPDGGKKFSQEAERPAKDTGVKMSQTNTAAADAAMEKLNLGPKPDIIDNTKANIAKLRKVDRGVVESWVDRFIKKANTEVLDALAPIKYAEDAAGVTDAADSGYVAARMATGAASTMQATMLYGLPEWKDGVIQRKAGTGEKDALLGIFSDLGADLHNWLGWMAGHRAELLMKQGRENLLSEQDIEALKGLGKGKEAKFNEAKARWNRLNAATLDLAQEAGLFTKEARSEFESEWYIPFFRESEDGDVLAPFKPKGIANQNSGIKKLKGGEANTADLLENIFTSTSKLIDASMKNMAAQKTVWNLADTGIIEVVAKPNMMDWRALKNGKNLITVKMEGEDYMIKVEDPDLYRAMTFFDRQPFGAMVNMAAKAKRLLTAGVTASPEFMLRNFLRDSLSSWAISKDGFKPVIDSIKGVKKTLAMDGSTIDVMFSGASFLGGYVNGNDPGAMADTVRKSLRRKGMTPEQIARYEKSIIRNVAHAKGVVADAWEKYSRYGEALENANREAVYDAAIKAGKSHAQAAFESKDLMDFSMMGGARAIQAASMVLPFFNARIQGLGKLTRELRDNPREIAKRAGMITAMSLGLLAANWDDERYEELPDWDKDANWHFFVGDQHWRIPKPFEIGVMFGTIPERMVRAMGDKDTGAQFGKAVARAIGDTFALNPTPQIVKPMVEAAFNYDTFRGGPIDSPQDLAVQAEARYNEQTSLLMRKLGEVSGFSPKQLEHLVIGYTGTIGGYVMATADGLIRAASPGESASWRADEIPLVKSVYRGTGPAKSTQHMEQFYQMLNEVNQLKRTIDQYRSEGLTDKANELLDEQGGILKSRRSLSRTQQQVRVVRNKIELIQRDRTMNAEEKRRRIDELLTRRNDLVYQAVNKNRVNWE